MAQRTALRNAIIGMRLTAVVTSAVSLAFFIIVLHHILYWYESQSTGLSVLPVVALGISILWNLIAIVTFHVIARTSHAMIDLLVFCILVALGSIGFVHDDNDYLSNGHYLSADSNWLNQEIAAGGCMVASAVLQLLIVVLNLFSARKLKMLSKHEEFAVVYPPPYSVPAAKEPSKAKLSTEKEMWFEEIDGKSLRSTSTLSDWKKGKSAEA